MLVTVKTGRFVRRCHVRPGEHPQADQSGHGPPSPELKARVKSRSDALTGRSLASGRSPRQEVGTTRLCTSRITFLRNGIPAEVCTSAFVDFDFHPQHPIQATMILKHLVPPMVKPFLRTSSTSATLI